MHGNPTMFDTHVFLTRIIHVPPTTNPKQPKTGRSGSSLLGKSEKVAGPQWLPRSNRLLHARIPLHMQVLVMVVLMVAAARGVDQEMVQVQDPRRRECPHPT
jgi:hypothetical protein